MVPLKLENEIIEAVSKVIKSGNLSSLHGEEVEKFESDFKNYIGSDYAIAVNSGTAALHTALLALGIGPGDEVICPAWTFVATGSAVLMCGAKPVFVDISRNSFNINPHAIGYKVTDRTRAIIVVHIAGIPCDMDSVISVAKQFGLYVIEDACQALGSSYDNEMIGSIGYVGIFSFYPSKMITSGEGGMIVTNDHYIFKKGQIIRNHGQSHKYNSIILGYNYRMTEIQAAIGQVTLGNIDREIHTRNTRAEVIKRGVDIKFTWPEPPKKSKVAYSYFPVLFKEEGYRFINWYTPLYKMPIFEGEKLPNTEHAWRFGYATPLI